MGGNIYGNCNRENLLERVVLPSRHCEEKKRRTACPPFRVNPPCSCRCSFLRWRRSILDRGIFLVE